jgi:chromosome segregation ATPase
MSDACHNCGMHDGQHISDCYYATDKQYIHQLEGWLAEVRERSASLLAERNELRAKVHAAQEDEVIIATLRDMEIDAAERAEKAEAAITELEAELEALKALVQKKASWEARLTDAEHALIWEALP